MMKAALPRSRSLGFRPTALTKPASQGSSVGITKVKTAAQFAQAYAVAHVLKSLLHLESPMALHNAGVIDQLEPDEVIVIEPARSPPAVGVKISCSSQLVAKVSVPGQLFVWEKSPWIAMLLIPISTDALVLAISTGTAGVEIPMGWGAGRRSTVVG